MTATADGSPEGVGQTAIGAAMMRARERLRPDPLFDDSLAEAFVCAAPSVFDDGAYGDDDDPAITELEAAFADAVSIRTRFYDDALLEAVTGGTEQGVLLGAGLDTRAFRLPLPESFRLFELDTPEVLAFKARVLAQEHANARCTRSTVGVDLREEWTSRLRDSGFDPSKRTVWIVEGLMPYLSDDAAQRLLVGIGELSPTGSRLALDQPTASSDSLLARAQAVEAMNHITSLWHGGFRDDAVVWLDEHGWDAERVDTTALANTYRRNHLVVAADAYIRATRRRARG